MHAKYLIIAGMMLALPNAEAAEPAACETSLNPLAADTLIPAPSAPGNDAIEFHVGELEAQMGTAAGAHMSGGVLLRHGSKQAGADEARINPENRSLLLEGNVRYQDGGTQVVSDLAEIAYDAGSVRFEGADFSLGNSDARGAAAGISINRNGQLDLAGVQYTTCPPDSNDWLIEADSIHIDSREGVATARHMKLRFQGVPILWAPYLSFPIGDARKTGVLSPSVGTTARSGNELILPYYLNLAPNYDATITPHLMSDRGLLMETEFRYLSESAGGLINVDYIDSDNMFNDSRYFVGAQHRMLLGDSWRNRINFSQVSDSQYFEDMGGSLSASSITHLDRNLSFDMFTEHLSIFAQVQDFQTIDDAIIPEDEPYRRVPQLLASGRWPDQWLGMDLGFSSEVVNFDRDVGVTGWRINVAPEVALPFTGPGWFVKPAVVLDYTYYDLSNTEAGQPESANRTVPIASLDVGMVLERAFRGSSRVQTIEPRLMYAHIPFREQSDLPVFDTITPDLHLVQLYRANRYLGVDRIADTSQVSIGVTSRILDVATGRDLVTATIGQIRYFADSTVTLPGQDFVPTDSSDYVAEISFLINKNINFDLGTQWGTSSDGVTQAEARVQYAPSTNKVLNLAYRFRRDSLEQGDVSWSWPLASNWNFVGRYNFSFRDDETLEQFYGLEYESCCWGLRLVSRRHISTRDGTQDSSIGLQLILKGMTSIGTSADKILERGILGYSADIR